MTVHDAIRARRSIRKYKSDPVPEQHIRQLLDSAMLAPSAKNTRPWEFAVVRDRALREQITQVSPYAKPVLAAPVAIVVSARPDLGTTPVPFWQQDCGAAIQNLLLEAVELGYGTCWCGLYPMEERSMAVKALLGLTGDQVPLGVIALGVPDEAPNRRGFYDESRVKFF